MTPITGLIGSIITYPLTNSPTNYIVIGAYIIINGTPESNNMDTDALNCSIGPMMTPVYDAGDILNLTGAVNTTSLFYNSLGYKGNISLNLILEAKLGADEPGNLAHIVGLESIEFNLYYIQT